MGREARELLAIRNFASVIFIIFVPTLLGVYGVQITDLRVPNAVRNGTAPVVLDCEYTLKQDEINQNSGLVVKWFFNNSPAPVYQWIIGKKPQDLGILKGKLNLRHRVSDNSHTMHRALYINNPTTELSGEYKCFVSTFNDEDFMTKKMVVFAPERKLELISHRPGLDSVNITCKAQGVYPEPKMTLYRDPTKDPERKTQSGHLDGVITHTSSRAMGSGKSEYDIVATKIIGDQELQAPTVFDCELRIPDANYVVRKSIVYYPGTMFASTESGAQRLHRGHSFCLLLISMIRLLTSGITV